MAETSKKTVALILCLAIILALLSGIIAFLVIKNANVPGNQIEDQGKLQIDVNDSEFTASGEGIIIKEVNLASAGVVVGEGYLTKVLTATVYPETVKDKAVDWSIEWGNNPKGDAVTNYVTVTPQSDGSTTATVKCIKPFKGSEIIIFCRSRVADVYASAVCTYVGTPVLGVSAVGVTKSNNANIGEYYSLNPGNTYWFDYVVKDVFGEDIDYSAGDFSWDINKVGSFYVQKCTYDGANGTYTYTGESSIRTLASVREVSPYAGDLFYVNGTQSGRLGIQVNCTIEDFYTESRRAGQNTVYENRFKAYVDDNWYYEFVITDNNTGLSTSFKVRFERTVKSIILSDNRIEF